MDRILKIWEAISNIGINADVSYTERIKVRVLNQLVTVVLPMETAIAIYFFFKVDFVGLVIGFGIPVFSLALLVFNKYRKFKLSQILLSIIFPLLMLGIGITCGEKSGIQYNLMLFIVIAFFFHNKLWLRIFFGFYNIIFYFVLSYYWDNYSSPYEYLIGPIFKPISFIITIAAILTIFRRFVTEISIVNENNQELLKTLEANNEELKSANEALERFAYIASHDLKTPLRTISGFTELLERDYNNGNTERFAAYFLQVKKGARQMNELIKNTLEYSRVNHLKEEKKWVNLNEIVSDIFMSYVTDDTIEINTTDLPKIFAERNQILSLFQNLIENGIKYNDKPRKKILVSSEETPYSIVVSIKDNGIGIPKKFHEQIFTMFKRLHTNQKYEGTGLGLAICEKIVDKMNGQISLSSIEGEGTTFYIILPKIGDE